MNHNFIISRTEASKNGDGTVIYYSFNYPETGNSESGNVTISNTDYRQAMINGTDADLYAGLYKAVQKIIIEQNGGQFNE